MILDIFILNSAKIEFTQIEGVNIFNIDNLESMKQLNTSPFLWILTKDTKVYEKQFYKMFHRLTSRIMSFPLDVSEGQKTTNVGALAYAFTQYKNGKNKASTDLHIENFIFPSQWIKSINNIVSPKDVLKKIDTHTDPIQTFPKPLASISVTFQDKPQKNMERIGHILSNVLHLPFRTKLITHGVLYESLFDEGKMRKTPVKALIQRKTSPGNGKPLVYAETQNQVNALKGVINNQKFTVVGPKSINPEYTLPYKHSAFQNIINAAHTTEFLAHFNTPRSSIERVVSRLQAWSKIIKDNKPSHVIVANDHSPRARALWLTAAYNNIPIVYTQHASIAPYRYPALRTDYALLDGPYALDMYDICEKNDPALSILQNKTKPEIFFTGNKTPKTYPQKKGNYVGVSFNDTDDIDTALQILSQHLDPKTLRIRTHPRQAKKDVDNLVEYSKSTGAQLFLPKDEPLDIFMSNIHTLICGNSGILLDAVMAGKKTAYLHTSLDTPDDTFCYVEKKLTNRLGDSSFACPNQKQKQYIDVTHGTVLQNKGTEIFQRAIDCILNDHRDGFVLREYKNRSVWYPKEIS